jgi:hypothetical protein
VREVASWRFDGDGKIKIGQELRDEWQARLGASGTPVKFEVNPISPMGWSYAQSLSTSSYEDIGAAVADLLEQRKAKA